MTPGALLSVLEARGVSVRAEGPNLRLRAPRGVLTDDLRRAVSSHKGGLLALLRIQEELLRLGAADPTASAAFADLPGEVLEVVASLQIRFGGVIVGLRQRESDVTAPVVDDPPRACFACKGTDLWRSIQGAVVCGNCHPPAAPELVAEWIGGDRPPGSPKDGEPE